MDASAVTLEIFSTVTVCNSDMNRPLPRLGTLIEQERCRVFGTLALRL